MKIAHLLPTSAVFPLKKHNGRYEWALRLARAQAAAGHDVTIFAGKGSTDASAVSWRFISSDETDRKIRNLALLRLAFDDTSYDIYHSHFDTLHYRVADRTNKPVVVTQHWFPQPSFSEEVRYNSRHNVTAVPVTRLMQAEDKRLGIPATNYIYHGIDLSLFTYSPTAGDRFLFVGRIHPNKGVGDAIRYAIQAGVPLDIIGKVNETERVFWEELQPHIDGERIRYLGQKSLQEVATAYRHARAFIFPNTQAEAFGQVTIEAQACGTPVIISDIGASDELVRDGVTGFVCRSGAEFIEAMQNIQTLSRHDCRRFAEQFDQSVMFAAYEGLYKQLVYSAETTGNS